MFGSYKKKLLAMLLLLLPLLRVLVRVHATTLPITSRLDSKLAATSANIFKFGPAHILVFPKRHDALPLMTGRELQEVFALALHWAWEEHQQDFRGTHLSLIFDAMPHGGASQAHPHLHAILGRGEYPGQFRVLHEATKKKKGMCVGVWVWVLSFKLLTQMWKKQCCNFTVHC